MLKSLALQAEMAREFGACGFGFTLDCEDGASVGGERDHTQMVRDNANPVRGTSAGETTRKVARVAVRSHPVDHPAFQKCVDTMIGGAAADLCHVMFPKVESLADVELAVIMIDRAATMFGKLSPLPLQVLIESAVASGQTQIMATHARVQSISIGLTDFFSSHGGVIPGGEMGVGLLTSMEGIDQFFHLLVLRAKLEISAACRAQGKVPSHCVVTEFRDTTVIQAAAVRAFRSLEYSCMWGVRPARIGLILVASASQTDEIDLAVNIILSNVKTDWASRYLGQLHDRASCRYFWQVLERAHQTGTPLANEASDLWH